MGFEHTSVRLQCASSAIEQQCQVINNSKLFMNIKFLGANLQVEKLHRLQWNVMNEVPTSSHMEGGRDAVKAENGWLVTLQPFQIRTFIIDLNAKL